MKWDFGLFRDEFAPKKQKTRGKTLENGWNILKMFVEHLKIALEISKNVEKSLEKSLKCGQKELLFLEKTSRVVRKVVVRFWKSADFAKNYAIPVKMKEKSTENEGLTVIRN